MKLYECEIGSFYGGMVYAESEESAKNMVVLYMNARITNVLCAKKYTHSDVTISEMVTPNVWIDELDVGF